MNRRSGFVVVLLAAVTVLALWPTVRAQTAESAAALNASAFAQRDTPAQNTTFAAAQGWVILSPTQGVDFSPYMRQLLARVHQSWYKSMPQQAMLGEDGKVSVAFAIRPGGSLSPEGPVLETSSHHKALDQAALLAIHNSAPFAALPHKFHGNLKLRVSFFYNTRPQ
jgi:TonB family protein